METYCSEKQAQHADAMMCDAVDAEFAEAELLAQGYEWHFISGSWNGQPNETEVLALDNAGAIRTMIDVYGWDWVSEAVTQAQLDCPGN